MIEKDKFVQYMGVENSDKGNCNWSRGLEIHNIQRPEAII
jgi:hypothetical protein